MKKNTFLPSRPAVWRAINILIPLLCASAPALAAPTPGSPEMPLIYEGQGLVDPKAPDGHLMYCPGVQNIEISRASRKPSPFFNDQPGYTYQHHMDLACWKGRLYAVWDMTPKDEDVPPCRLCYATSTDGLHWSEPKDLYPPNEGWNLRFNFYHAANDRMLVFAAAPYTAKSLTEKKKTTILVRELNAEGQLGEIYTFLKPGEGHPPSYQKSKDKEFVAACREAYNNKPLLEQQDYGVLLGDRKMKWHYTNNWPDNKIAGEGKFWTFGKALCFFHRQDGELVGLCKMGYATLSADGGETWSKPVIPTGIVAGFGKVWGQKTPDGRYAMVYPPQDPGPRFPMVITTSDDGITFRDMRVMHGEVPPVRYQGKYKDVGPQYLRGVAEWAGDAPTVDKSAIWVIYSMNKEDIWVSRIPVPILADAKEEVHDTFDSLPEGPRVPGWNTYTPTWTSVQVAKDPGGENKYLQLEDRDPVDYARAIRTFPPSTAADISFRLSAAQADHGRMEIEVLGEKGARPVRIVLDGHGKVRAADGAQMKDAGDYSGGQWSEFKLKIADGKYELSRDGKKWLEGATFAEPSSLIYALSFRTGEFRGTVTDKATADMKDTEEPAAAAVYRVDDVMTSDLQRLKK